MTNYGMQVTYLEITNRITVHTRARIITLGGLYPAWVAMKALRLQFSNEKPGRGISAGMMVAIVGAFSRILESSNIRNINH
jgi:hypothetical protein